MQGTQYATKRSTLCRGTFCGSTAHDSITKTKMIHKRSTALERSVKYFTGGLNRFHGAQTSPLVQMWIKTHSLVCMKDP